MQFNFNAMRSLQKGLQFLRRKKETSLIFFSEASERAGILNPQIWLANHTYVTGPAIYDTAHGPDFYLAA